MNIQQTKPPAIDMRAITQLAEGDDQGDKFINEIITVFLADLDERVSRIGDLAIQGDRAGVAAMAHAIKGSCGHFGALLLLQLTRDLEIVAKKDQTGPLQPAIDAMIEEAERVRAALEAYRSERSAPTSGAT